VLAEILSLSEPKSYGNDEAVRADVRMLAAYMKIADAWQYEVAATLARIGQVSIPPEVTLKQRIGHGLSPAEEKMLAQVPSVGANLLAQIPRMEEVSRMILFQDKHFDGTGFPEEKISGENIPLGARILKALFDLVEVETGGVAREPALQQLRSRPGRL
jgi:response regulator RpfG family c-di-GMP phosphodiesterase